MKELYLATYILLAIRFIRAILRKLSLHEPENAEYALVMHDDAVSAPIVLLRNKKQGKACNGASLCPGKRTIKVRAKRKR